ncbi:MAG: prolyl oligopeptidase family serine peptidase [Acidobacteria bacterium]|nr:prolyl oligopeptidase family serine peptidase [Acidobacteriota bacterium]
MTRLLFPFLAAAALTYAAKWTPDDLLMSESVQQMELSRDGKLAVYVKSGMDKEKGEPVSNLVLYNLADAFEVVLTRGKDNHSSPHFSPDGRYVAFLSSRSTGEDAAPSTDASSAGRRGARGGMQVWRIDLRGGEPEVLTRMEKGVSNFAWLDANTLLLAAAEDATLHEQRIKERKDTSQVVEDEQHATPVRLFRFDLKAKKARRLTENRDRIATLAVSPDGKWAVTTHDRSLSYVWDQKLRPSAFLHDLQAGTSRQLFADGKLLPRAVQFALDSKGFYFEAPHTTHPRYLNAAIQRLYFMESGAATPTEIPLDWPNGLSQGYVVTAGGIIAQLANGVRPKVARYQRNGQAWSREFLATEHAGNIFGMQVAGDRIVYLHSTASKPGQWFSGKLSGAKVEAARQFTETNAAWKKKPIAKSEPYTWKGAKDETVEGILHYPHNYQAGRKYPLVVMIHGGPHGADLDNFSERWGYPVQLMAQRGAFILRPNYHGSSNYGLAFGESISGGNYNDLEWVDVERGVDSLVARGMVDPDKLGTMGWSNGSIITIELTTRTTRYKVASAGAGDVNWISDWGNCEFGHSFDDYYIGKTPLEAPDLYIKKSPLFRMDKVRTPTIIFFGTEDKQVPTEQGWQHYRALKHLEKTDVRFILFPGEGHGPRKYVHQRRKLDEELAWFDKYLFKTLADKNEALRPESPLAALLLSRKRADVPDTVERGDFAIGRFEVTRAQYRAFDPSYAVEKGTENHPAAGLSYEQARKYCEWLSTKTATKYRLPTEEEVGAMLAAKKDENTLDAWAGYAVNPDDAARLSSLIQGLGPGALLKPVGSHAGSGEDPVFDLGGNAAEWVVAKDGAAKVMGGSADQPVDAKSSARPAAGYVGFRGVREM